MTNSGRPVRGRDKLSAMSSDAPPAPKEDVVFVHGPAEGGDGYRVIRKRDDAIELGEIRAVKEGRPLHGDLVRLTQRKEHDRLFDVETVVPREKTAPALSHAGPAQVATDAYRDNWEAIFGPRGEPEMLN